MSSYWDGNYVFGQYPNEAWVPENVPSCIPDSNEQEEVVSSVQGKQNRPFLDLNTHPPVDKTSPVDDSYHAGQPSYPTQQGYPDYGYGCENSYVQQHYPDGYGGDVGHQQLISPSGPYVHQNYSDVGGYGGYGGEAPPISDNPYLKKQVSILFCYVR
ncbi:hypothetical protein Hanom_Chr09g00775231 [Helianthus anomalus]